MPYKALGHKSPQGPFRALGVFYDVFEGVGRTLRALCIPSGMNYWPPSLCNMFSIANYVSEFPSILNGFPGAFKNSFGESGRETWGGCLGKHKKH